MREAFLFGWLGLVAILLLVALVCHGKIKGWF
jgi:hypothetical protein